MIYVLALIQVVYCMYVLTALYAFYLKTKLVNDDTEGAKPDFIAICFRNENENLNRLLSFFQSFNHTYTLLFIDDHSNDGSDEAVKKSMGTDDRIRYIPLSNVEYGKKSAVKKALSSVPAEAVVWFWDADVYPTPELIHATRIHHSVDVQIMPAWPKSKGNEWIALLEQMETSGIWVLNVLHSNYMKPLVAQGANLLVRNGKWTKSIDWFPQTLSGDDMAILHSAYQNKRKVSVDIKLSRILETSASSSLSMFLNRRIRWSNKPFRMLGFSSALSGLFVLLTNLAVYALLVLVLKGNTNLSFFILLKFITDWLVALMVFSHWKKPFNVVSFFFLWLGYPFLLMLILTGSVFKKTYWKDRPLKT
jgi:glycosyltransferase involved in cell wall biosynthesis